MIDDRPYPARTDPLPGRLDDVTPEWFEGMLRLRHPGISLRGWEIVEVKNSHTTKLRVRLDLDQPAVGEPVPEHVCLKANWSGLVTGQICAREARFYNFAESAGGGWPVPRSWFADWDEDNGLVVMEDLARSPGAFGASSDRLGVDGVAAGLESLAAVHAATWADPGLARQRWLPGSMATDNDTEQVAQYWNYIKLNLADPAYRRVVPAWILDTPEVMHHALDELAAFERERVGPRCLVHGDAHQGNSFLRAGGERVWLDWQLARRGSPLRDVSYFVVSSLTVDERRRSERDLVELHRQHLLARGLPDVPTADDAWAQYVRWPAYGVQAWLGNVNLWGQSEGATMVERHAAAAEDLGTIDVLTRGRTPRRTFVPGEGAYRLPRALRAQLERGVRSDAGAATEGSGDGG
jgi:hypothetical protein